MSFKDPLDAAAGGTTVGGSLEGGAEQEVRHLPVMAGEVVEILAPRSGSLQIDATLGGAGHAERILDASSPEGRLLGLDAAGAASARSARRHVRQLTKVGLPKDDTIAETGQAPAAGFGQVD